MHAPPRPAAPHHHPHLTSTQSHNDLATGASAEEQAATVMFSAQEAPEVLDLLLCSLSVAATHYRKASVCTPFPRWLSGAQGTRDYQRCAAALQGIPRVRRLASPEGAAALPPDLRRLSAWLLASLESRQPLQPISLRTFLVDVAARTGRGASPFSHAYLEPTLAFAFGEPRGGGVAAISAVAAGIGGGGGLPGGDGAVVGNGGAAGAAAGAGAGGAGARRGSARQPWHGSGVLCYHGTSFENLHSILHNGLLVMSSTKGQRTGALFGDGIYLSTELSTAFGFCIGQPVPWGGTALGSVLRCVLVCEASPEALGEDERRRHSEGGALPQTYIVASSPSQVLLRYLLIYVDRPPTPQPPTPRGQQQQRGGSGGMFSWLWGGGDGSSGSGSGSDDTAEAAAAGVVAAAAACGAGAGSRAHEGYVPVRRINWCSVIVGLYCGVMVALLLWKSLPPRTRRKLLPSLYANANAWA